MFIIYCRLMLQKDFSISDQPLSAGTSLKAGVIHYLTPIYRKKENLSLLLLLSSQRNVSPDYI